MNQAYIVGTVVDIDDVPVLSSELGRGIVGKARINGSINSDIVVVVDQDQVVETPVSSKRYSWYISISLTTSATNALNERRLTLHTDTLLDTTITSHRPNLAIDNWESILVVLRSKLFSSYGQTDSIGDTLTQRSRSDFNTWKLDLGMTSSHSMMDRGVIISDLVKCPLSVSREMEHDVL